MWVFFLTLLPWIGNSLIQTDFATLKSQTVVKFAPLTKTRIRAKNISELPQVSVSFHWSENNVFILMQI